jgi:hypothetical protein
MKSTVKYDLFKQFVRFDAESASKLCIITESCETIKRFTGRIIFRFLRLCAKI